MSDERVDELLNEWPPVTDPELRERAKAVARRIEGKSQADARWARIERAAVQFAIAFYQENERRVPWDKCQESAIRAAVLFVGALDRARAEEIFYGDD